MHTIQDFINAIAYKRAIDDALEYVRIAREYSFLFDSNALDYLALELLKERERADNRIARAITEFKQITRNERED